MKQNNKNRIMILLLILVLAIILIILSIVLIKNDPLYQSIDYIYDETNEGEIGLMPLRVDALFTKYKGTTNQRSIYKAMYSFVDEIVPKYYETLKIATNEQIVSYYKENSFYIEKELGIRSVEEFTGFIETIQKLNTEELVLKEYTVNPNTVTRNIGYLEFVLIVKYENNPTIGFKLNILNTANTSKTPIEYRGNVKDSLLEYEYEIPKYENTSINQMESTGKVL